MENVMQVIMCMIFKIGVIIGIINSIYMTRGNHMDCVIQSFLKFFPCRLSTRTVPKLVALVSTYLLTCWYLLIQATLSEDYGEKILTDSKPDMRCILQGFQVNQILSIINYKSTKNLHGTTCYSQLTNLALTMQGKSVQYVYPGYGYLIRWFLKGLTSNQIVLNCVPEN